MTSCRSADKFSAAQVLRSFSGGMLREIPLWADSSCEVTMSFAVVCAICLLQAQFGGVNPPERLEHDVLEWQTQHMADSAANQPVTREAKYEEQQFVNKFNNLLDTLRDFADQYNHHVIDVKKLKALKKAWRDLENTDAWFRLNDKAGH